MDRSRIASWVALAIFLLGYVAVQLWIMISSNFYAYLNDFWFLRKLGNEFTGLNPEVLQDGFFPYLYPLVQTIVPESVALQASSVASLIAAVGTIVVVYLAASRIVGSGWALIAAWVVALQPSFFTYASVAGADAISALPVALALLVLTYWFKGEQAGNSWILLCAGFLLGVSGTLRHHALILALLPVLVGALSSRNRLKSVIAAFAGVLFAYLPQMLVNVSAGYPPYTSMQGFNVYRVAVGVDWPNTSSLDPSEYASPLAVLSQHPYETATAYLSAFESFLIPLILVAAAAALMASTVWRVLGRSLLVTSVLYSALTSLAFSSRALIVLVPILALASSIAAGLVVRHLVVLKPHDKESPRTGVTWAPLLALLVLTATFSWVQAIPATGIERVQKEYARSKVDNDLARVFVGESMLEVVSNDFDFYSMRIPGQSPRHQGGIAQISQRDRAGFAELDSSTIRNFLCTANEQGVRWVLWSSQGYQALPDPVVSYLFALDSNRAVSLDIGEDQSRFTLLKIPAAGKDQC